jgi:hypothetical protein
MNKDESIGIMYIGMKCEIHKNNLLRRRMVMQKQEPAESGYVMRKLVKLQRQEKYMCLSGIDTHLCSCSCR